MARQRRSATRAIRHDLVPFVEQPFFVDRLECPPDALDIVVVIGDIRVFHIRPEANAVGHGFPVGLVFPDRLLAFLDKRLDSVGFNLLFAVEAELFFHLDLHRKPMGIPARLAQHVVTLHGLIARDDILDRAREHMADVRLSVCRRRPVKEGIRLCALSQAHAFLEDLLLLPKREHFFLARDKIQLARYFFVHVDSLSLFCVSENHQNLVLRKTGKKIAFRPKVKRDEKLEKPALRGTTLLGEKTRPLKTPLTRGNTSRVTRLFAFDARAHG